MQVVWRSQRVLFHYEMVCWKFEWCCAKRTNRHKNKILVKWHRLQVIIFRKRDCRSHWLYCYENLRQNFLVRTVQWCLRVGLPPTRQCWAKYLFIENKTSFYDSLALVALGFTLHGDSQTSTCATEWKLDAILHEIWKLLNYSLARGDIDITFDQCNDFSLSFCKTGWFEDEKVAARAILIWPFLFESLCPSNWPKKNKSWYFGPKSQKITKIH